MKLLRACSGKQTEKREENSIIARGEGIGYQLLGEGEKRNSPMREKGRLSLEKKFSPAKGGLKPAGEWGEKEKQLFLGLEGGTGSLIQNQASRPVKRNTTSFIIYARQFQGCPIKDTEAHEDIGVP